MNGTKIDTPFGKAFAQFIDLRSGTPTILLDSCTGDKEFWVSGIGVSVSLLLADYGKGFVSRRESGQALTVRNRGGVHPAVQSQVALRIRRGLIAAVNAWAATDEYADTYAAALESIDLAHV